MHEGKTHNNICIYEFITHSNQLNNKYLNHFNILLIYKSSTFYNVTSEYTHEMLWTKSNLFASSLLKRNS